MSGKRKANKKGRGGNVYSSFIPFERYIANSAAWRDLSSNARSAYLEVAYGYDGTNNGRIIASSQTLGERMGCNKSTAARALIELTEHGFIVCQKKGGFVCKVRHASEYRLTAFKCDVTGDLPLKPFMRWQPQIQKSVARAQPHGGMGATVKENKPAKTASRWRGRNHEDQFEAHHGGTGATLLYSNHREVATSTAVSDGAGNPKARDQRETVVLNLIASTANSMNLQQAASPRQVTSEMEILVPSKLAI